MTEEEREERQVLKDAYRFAVEQFAQETRSFWGRVAALLTVNSVLVAAFMVLYTGEHTNACLLLTIAACGITIQLLWPIFAITSYDIFEYWRKLMRDIEGYLYTKGDCKDLKDRVRRIWTCFGDRPGFFEKDKRTCEKSEEPGKSRERCKRLYACVKKLWSMFCRWYVKKPHPGLIATSLFFVVFMVIWLVAAYAASQVLAAHFYGYIIEGIVGFIVFAKATICVARWVSIELSK